MAHGKWWAITSILVAGLAHSQVPTPIRSVSSLPATCKGGSAVQSSDMVVLIGGGVGVTYMCTAPNTWTPIAGGGSISGSPAVSTQVAGNGSAFVAQTKPIYDTRDWMTCDGATDASGGMGTLISTIGTQEATIVFRGTTNASNACRIGNTFFPANVILDFSGGGSIQLISSTTVPGGAGFVNGTSVECGVGVSCAAPALTTTVGNTLVVMDAPYPGFTFKITSVTDNCGDFFVHVFQSTVGQTRNQGMWVASNITGGNCTVTAAANGSLTNNTIIIQQYSGMGPVAAMDGQGASSNAVTNPMSSGAATTTAGSLLIGFGGQPFTAETCTAGAGFIQPAGLVGQTANGFMCAEYQLSSAGGAVTATQNITSLPANQVYSLVALKPGNATATIYGGIVNPDMHQIFFNADGATGHGVVDFTGNTGITTVYPEWWGATNAASAATNTLALQAAEYGAFGCGPNACRPNGSGLNQYNKTLYLTSNYKINDELKFYHAISFKVVCASRLFSGITQTAVNKRIIDGQSVAYGAFYDCGWSGTAASTGALLDLDFNGVTTAGDLATQFVDFYNNVFSGNSLVDTGVLISKSGGGAQGSNIYCYDCESISFTGAAWQVGGNNTGRNVGRNYAGNALDIGYSGDIQGSPLYGIAVYGGGYVSFSAGANGLATMENGGATQTGFDMYCEQTQGPCIMEHMRSESRRLIAGSNLRVIDSRTINLGSFPNPGFTDPVNTIKTGNAVTGDGAYYKVTVNASAYSGIGTPSAPLLASSGTLTSITDTNQTVAGSVTIGTFVAAELLTQAVSGSTATLLNVPSSLATVTGTNTSGQFVSGEIATQSVTGITATVQSPTPNLANPTLSLLLKNLSGTADSTHTWVGGTSAAVYTPSAAPTFSVASPVMLITAATGAPDNSHNWVGGTSAAVLVPTAVPVNVANFTVNAFTGMLVGMQSGTSINCYGVVTSNTATAITFSAGLLTKYPLTSCPAPDSTSKFVVEPSWNHGSVVDGGMTLVYINENVIEGDAVSGVFQGTLQDVIIPGGQLKPWGNGSSRTIMKNVLVSRADWYNNSSGNNPQGCCTIDRDWDVRPILPGASTPINWSYPSNTGITYSGPIHKDWGTNPLCWNIGTVAVVAANEVCIGGRSDPNAGTVASRNIFEIPTAMIGRPAPLPSAVNSYNLTDQNGTDFDITGGPSTGAGNGGAVNFWTSNPGASSATVNAGLKRWLISTAGHFFAGLDNTYDIGATAANRPRRVFAATDFVGPIGATTPATGSFTTLATSGLLTNYNGITTAGLGFPVQVGVARLVAQTTNLGPTTLFTVGANTSQYLVTGTVYCDTTVATATVSLSLGYTDPASQAQTITSGTAACTALGSGSLALVNTVISAKNATTITYSTTTANSPNYDVRLQVYQLSSN